MLVQVVSAAKAFTMRKVIVWGIVALLSGGSAYAVYRSISNAYTKAADYDAAVADLAAANTQLDEVNQKLLDLTAYHAEEVARMEQVRLALQSDRSAILKAAQIEGGKFRQLKERFKDVEEWSNTDVPASVKRLYLGKQETSESGS